MAAARPTAEVQEVVAKVAVESFPPKAPAQVAETAMETATLAMTTALDMMAAGREATEATEKAQAVASEVTR